MESTKSVIICIEFRKIGKNERGEAYTMVTKWPEKRDLMKERLTIRKKGQVTLPKSILERFDLHEGDTLEIEVNEHGEITVVPLMQIPVNQSWFWTDTWQKEEAEAQNDIITGHVKSFNNVEDLLADLDRDED